MASGIGMKRSGRIVAVTGASGFIGRQLVADLLSRGLQVEAVVHGRGDNLPKSDLVHVRQVDLLDGAAAEAWIRENRPEVVLHGAWYTVHGRYWTAAENDDWASASCALMSLLARNGCRRFVGVGTCAEYSWEEGVFQEMRTPIRPATSYGIAKNRARLHLEEVCRDYGMRGAWARIFYTFGPGEPPQKLVASIIRALLRGEPALCGSGEQVRDFTYVKDVAEALASLILSDVEGPVNIASGEPMSVRDLATQVAGRFDGGRVEFGRIPSRPGDPPVLTADVGRLTREVGWHSRRKLADSIDETIAWWRGSR